MTDTAKWEAEGRFSFISFMTDLLRTDQGVLESQSFPFDEEFYAPLFWHQAQRSARTGSDFGNWITNLPNGLSDETRAKLFHERFHYAQISSYPMLQLKFIQELERIRLRIAALGGSPEYVCGQSAWDQLLDEKELDKALGALEALFSGQMMYRSTGRTVDGVVDAGVIDAAFLADQETFRGSAGALRFGEQWQEVPFTAIHFLESAAHIAEYLFRRKSPPRLDVPATKWQIRYLGCWELWCRLNMRRCASEHDLAQSFLAAVDLAMGAHVLAAHDDSLKERLNDPIYSAQMRFPHARFEAIALNAHKLEFVPSTGSESVRKYQDEICGLMNWPAPERAYNFMTALLTRQLLYSSQWRPAQGRTFNEERVKWAMSASLSEMANDIEKLQPVWKVLADSLSPSEDGTVQNAVIGSRLVLKMIAISRSRALGLSVPAAPHADPAELSRYFSLPLVRLGNRYYMDWDLSRSSDMTGPRVEDFYSVFHFATQDLVSDCISLAVLAPLVEREVRCGLIDPVTRERNCIYIAGGAGCPQAGLTSDEDDRRRREGVFDWCHWTHAILQTGLAPRSVRDQWTHRWQRRS